MKLKSVVLTAALLAAGLNSVAFADEKVLRLLTWSDYVPADVKAQFEKETGYKVEVTLSNNEEMISKLRATGGAGRLRGVPGVRHRLVVLPGGAAVQPAAGARRLRPPCPRPCWR